MPERHFLDWFALVITFSGITMVVMALMWLHEIPTRIAHANKHPQEEAIHWACWVSLFTMHALWPFIFLWAKTNPKAIPVTMTDDRHLADDLKALSAKVAALEARAQKGG
jgi:Na+/phosphate symporter